MNPAHTTSFTPRCSNQSAIAESRSSRESKSSRAKTAVSIPAASARSSACAPGRLELTPAIGSPSSISACRFVPSPETRTPITRSAGSHDPPDHELVAGILEHGAKADAEVEHAPQLLLLDVAAEPLEDRRTLPRFRVDL